VLFCKEFPVLENAVVGKGRPPLLEDHWLGTVLAGERASLACHIKHCAKSVKIVNIIFNVNQIVGQLRKLVYVLERPWLVVDYFSVFLERTPQNAFERCLFVKGFNKLFEGEFPLPVYDNVGVFAFKRLLREDACMPAAPDYWQLWICLPNLFDDVDCLLNVMACQDANGKAERVLGLVNNFLLIIVFWGCGNYLRVVF